MGQFWAVTCKARNLLKLLLQWQKGCYPAWENALLFVYWANKSYGALHFLIRSIFRCASDKQEVRIVSSNCIRLIHFEETTRASRGCPKIFPKRTCLPWMTVVSFVFSAAQKRKQDCSRPANSFVSNKIKPFSRPLLQKLQFTWKMLNVGIK